MGDHLPNLSRKGNMDINDSKSIRSELKKRLGYNSRQVSVRIQRYSMGRTTHFTIRDATVDYNAVKDFSEECESVRRCEYSGEILSGGNTYVRLHVTEEVERRWAHPLVQPIKDSYARLEHSNGLTIDGYDVTVWGSRSGDNRFHVTGSGSGPDGLTSYEPTEDGFQRAAYAAYMILQRQKRDFAELADKAGAVIDAVVHGQDEKPKDEPMELHQVIEEVCYDKRVQAKFPKLNKNDTLEEYRELCQNPDDYTVETVQIVKVLTFTREEWNVLVNSLLTSRGFFDGEGGSGSDYHPGRDWDESYWSLERDEQQEWIKQSYVLGLLCQCGGRQIIVNPEGYSYARYVGFPTEPVEMAEIGYIRSIREGKDAACQLMAACDDPAVTDEGYDAIRAATVEDWL